MLSMYVNARFKRERNILFNVCMCVYNRKLFVIGVISVQIGYLTRGENFFVSVSKKNFIDESGTVVNFLLSLIWKAC